MYCTVPVALTLAFTIAATRDDGLAPGQPIPGPYRAYIVFGGQKVKSDVVLTDEQANYADPTREGKFHCLVTRSGLDPTVAVFIREAPPAEDAPLAKLLRDLDAAVVGNPDSRLKAFAVFLGLQADFMRDDTRRGQIAAIREFAAKAELKSLPLALDEIESDRVQTYNLSTESSVIVLFFENQTVTARFVFNDDKPLTEAAVERVMAEVRKWTSRKR